jgi:NAD(P)-dependent dehydrogenase (short-subunit alcohol dehydrogenase family)
MEKKRLQGKVAIVTGAGRGMGRAHALLLAHEGARVVVNDLGGEPVGRGADVKVAAKVADEIRALGGEAVANSDSVALMDGTHRLISTAVESFGRLDILINNAGIFRIDEIEQMSEEDWDQVIAVHLKGCFATIKYATPIFRRQHSGVIVNIGSDSGLGHPTNSNYAAAKEGIIGLTRSLARELGRFGIRCNAVRPRAQTGMAAAFNERAAKYAPLMEALGKFAIGFEMADRFGKDYKPERVSALVVWLCTDAAANINGRTLYAGGDEVGLYCEPELRRTMSQPGGWDLDSLDANSSRLAGDLTNDFMLKDSIGDKEL